MIRPAVDPEFFCPSGPAVENGSVLRLVDVGWLRWRKGWEYALTAVAQLAAEGIPVRFDILGAEPTPDHAEPSERSRIAHTAESFVRHSACGGGSRKIARTIAGNGPDGAK